MRIASCSVCAAARELRALAVGAEHDIEQGMGAVWRLLGEPSNAGARRHAHLAALGAELAGDDAKQRGLPAAVAAHQAHARAR